MDLLLRFFGKVSAEPGALVAEPMRAGGRSLQLLFPEGLDLDADGMTQSLRSYHPELERAIVEWLPLNDEKLRRPIEDLIAGMPAPPMGIGLAGWGPHIVQMIGVPAPIPDDVLDQCIKPAHFHPELKEIAQQQRSHMLLFYAGRAQDPLEQYVALAAVAASLVRFEATFVLNENARAAVPTGFLLPDDGRPNEDMLEVLRTLPIPLLYGGFVKIQVEDTPGLCMRTFGCHTLDLPDLAVWQPDHRFAASTFDMLNEILQYARSERVRFAPGHTMQVGHDAYLKVRLPNDDERMYLNSPGELFVLDFIKT